MERKNYSDIDYSNEIDNNGYIDPEEYRKMRYYKNNADYPQDTYIDEPEDSRYIKKHINHPVLLFQIIVCLIAAIAVFVIKAIGGDIYNTVKNYYDSAINSSDIISDFFAENKIGISDKENTETTEENLTENTTDTTEETSSSGDANE